MGNRSLRDFGPLGHRLAPYMWGVGVAVLCRLNVGRQRDTIF